MGYEISLVGVSFDIDDWMRDLCETRDTLQISPMGAKLANMIEGSSPDEIWLHPVGGVRGVTLRLNENGAKLNLPAGVAEPDFILAGKLIRAAVAKGAKAEDEEGRNLVGSDDEMCELGRMYRQTFWSAIHNHLGKGPVRLPVGGVIQLMLGSCDRCESGWLGLEDAVRDKMARYEISYVASLIKMSEWPTLSFCSNFHHQPTLINRQAEWITLHGEHGDITSGKPVPCGSFYELLGGRLEDLGEWIYIPAIDFDSEPELAERCRMLVADTAPSPIAAPTPNAATSESTANIWRSGAIFFLCLGGAITNSDEKHHEARTRRFNEILSHPRKEPHEGVRKIGRILQGNAPEGDIDDLIVQEMERGAAQGLWLLARNLHSSLEFVPSAEAMELAGAIAYLARELVVTRDGDVSVEDSPETEGLLSMTEMLFVRMLPNRETAP